MKGYTAAKSETPSTRLEHGLLIFFHTRQGKLSRLLTVIPKGVHLLPTLTVFTTKSEAEDSVLSGNAGGTPLLPHLDPDPLGVIGGYAFMTHMGRSPPSSDI